jgi:hypothetical protein
MGALNKLINFVVQVLQRLSYSADSMLSFPVTFLKLGCSLPKFVDVLPKKQLLPLVSKLDAVSLLDVINLNNPQDRSLALDFCVQTIN